MQTNTDCSWYRVDDDDFRFSEREKLFYKFFNLANACSRRYWSSSTPLRCNIYFPKKKGTTKTPPPPITIKREPKTKNRNKQRTIWKTSKCAKKKSIFIREQYLFLFLFIVVLLCFHRLSRFFFLFCFVFVFVCLFCWSALDDDALSVSFARVRT